MRSRAVIAVLVALVVGAAIGAGLTPRVAAQDQPNHPFVVGSKCTMIPIMAQQATIPEVLEVRGNWVRVSTSNIPRATFNESRGPGAIWINADTVQMATCPPTGQ